MSTDQGSSKKTRIRHIRRVTALVTIMLLVIGSSVMWFVTGGVEKAQAGTLGSLKEASRAGAWQSIEPQKVDVPEEITENRPVSLDHLRDVVNVENVESFVIQVMVTAQESDAIVSLGEKAESADPLVRVAAGQTASVTSLVYGPVSGEGPYLWTTTEATIAVDVVAYFVPPSENESEPAPGGTVAASPFALVDLERNLGATAEMVQSGVDISPCGLGGVPTEGVAGVWLQVVADGGGVVVVPTTASGHETTSGHSVSSQLGGLTAVPLDSTGRFHLRAADEVTSVYITIVGWIAEAEHDTDRAVIDAGVLLGDPLTQKLTSGSPEKPASVPEGRSSLYRVSLTVEEVQQLGEFGGVLDAGTTQVDVNGEVSAVVVLDENSVLLHSDAVAEATWLGYFAGPIGDAATSKGTVPTVHIDSPQAGEEIDFTKVGGAVRFEGRVESTAGVTGVHIKKGNRYVGSASVRLGHDGYRWTYLTDAPTGKHSISVVAVDSAGEKGSASVEFSVRNVAENDFVAAPNVAVIGEDLMHSLEATSPTSLTFSTTTFVAPGDVVSVPISPATPDGALRKVTSVHIVDGQQVLQTQPAVLTDAIVNTHIVMNDAPVLNAEELAATSESGYADEIDVPAEYDEARQEAEAAGQSGDSLAAVDLSPSPESLRTEGIPSKTQALLSGWGHTGGGGISGLSKIADMVALPIPPIDYDKTKHSNSTQTKFQIKASGEKTDPPKKAKVVIETGTANASPSITSEFETNLNMKAFEAAMEKNTSDSSGFKNEHTGVWGFDISYTTKVHSYAKVEIKITRDDRWINSWGYSTVEIFEFSQLQVEETTFDVTLEGAYEGTFGPQRKDPKTWDINNFENLDLASFTKTDDIRIRLGGFPVPTPVPIYLSAYIKPSLGAKLTVKGSVTTGWQATEVRRVGSRYEYGRHVKVGEQRFARFPEFNLNAAIEIGLTLNFGVELEGKAYEALGVFAGIHSEFKGTTTAEFKKLKLPDEIDVELTFALDAVAGIRLEVFSHELFTNKITFTLVKPKPPIVRYTQQFNTDGTAKQEDTQLKASQMGDGDRPLVLVIDVSGSMSGDRIEGAKDTLQQVIQNQPLGAEIGIWTYPSDGGCSAGEFIVPLQAHAGLAELNETIARLTTGGSTPTGEALQAATYQMIAEGRTGGSLLLVSDGESNCSVDPCDTVKDIKAQGFELGVHTVGFDISEEGMEQLKCIADVTDSKSYQVENPDDLLPLIEDLTQTVINAEIVTPDVVAEGEDQKVTVRIDNPSVRDATGVEFVLQSSGSPSPVVARPNSIVGNIPANGRIERVIDVSASGRGDVNLELQAWGTNVKAVTAHKSYKIVVADAPELKLSPGPILAAGSAGVPGDSGESDAPNSSGETDLPGKDTRLLVLGDDVVAGGWERITSDKTDWDSVADVSSSDYTGDATLREQISSVEGPLDNVSHVVLGVGGAELDIEHVLLTCVKNECSLASTDYQNALRVAQEIRIDDEILRVWYAVNGEGKRARSGEAAAPIFVPAVPRLFPEDRGLRCSEHIGPDQVIALNTLVSFVNQSLDASVQRMREAGIEVYFVETTASALQASNSICAAAPGVVIEDDGDDGTTSIRLTTAGHDRIARAITQWSQERTREISMGITGVGLIEEPGFFRRLVSLPSPVVALGVDAPVRSLGVDMMADSHHRTGYVHELTGDVVMPGQTIEILGEGYLPESQVFISVDSGQLTYVGGGAADAEGRASVQVTMPTHINAGRATVVTLGTNENGESFRALSDVSIGAEAPMWVTGFIILSGLFAVVGVVVIGRSIVVRKRTSI